MISVPRRPRSGSAQDAFRIPKTPKPNNSSHINPLEVVSLSMKAAAAAATASSVGTSAQIDAPPGSAGATSTTLGSLYQPLTHINPKKAQQQPSPDLIEKMSSSSGIQPASESKSGVVLLPSQTSSGTSNEVTLNQESMQSGKQQQQNSNDSPQIVVTAVPILAATAIQKQEQSRGISPTKREQPVTTPSNIMFSLFKNEGLVGSATTINAQYTQDLLEAPPAKLTEIMESNSENKLENDPTWNVLMQVSSLINYKTEEENIFLAKKIKMLEDNAKFFEQKVHPLFVENVSLKGYLVSANEYVRERTNKFSTLVVHPSPTGENRELVKKIGNLDALFDCLQRDIAFYIERVKTLEENKQMNEQIVAQQSDVIQTLKDNVVSERESFHQQNKDKLAELESIVSFKSEQIDRFKKLLEDEQFIREKLEAELNGTIRKLTADLLSSQAQFTRMDIDRSKQIHALQQRVTSMVEQYAKEKKDMIHKHEVTVSNLRILSRNQLDELNRKIDELNLAASEELERREKMIADLNEAHEKKIDKLREVEMNLRGDIAEKQRKVAELEKQLKEVKSEATNLKRSLEKLQLSHDEFKEKSKVLGEELSVTKKSLEKEIHGHEHRLADYITEIKELKAKLAEEVESWSNKLAEAVANKELVLNRKFRAEKDQLEGIATNCRKEVDKLEKLIITLTQDYKNQLQKLSDEKFIVENNLVELKKDVQQRCANIEKMWEQKLDDEIMRGEERIKVLENAKNETIKAQEARRIKQIDDQERLFGEKFRDLVSAKDKAFAEMQASMEKANEEAEKIRLNEFTLMEKEKDFKILELETELRRNINEMKAYHALETEEFKRTYEDQIRRLKIQLESNARGLLNEIKGQHQRELEALRYELTSKMTSIDESWKDKTKVLVDEYETRLADLRSRVKGLEKTIEWEKENSAKGIVELSEKIVFFKDRVSEVQVELGFEKAANQELRMQLEGLTKVHKEAVLAHAAEKKIILESTQQGTESIKHSHEEEIKRIYQEQIEEIEVLKSEFMELRRQQEKRIEKYMSQYSELERLFSERPSRNEDIVYIHSLEKEVNGAKQNLTSVEGKIKQANHVVKYLQVELENYKATYDIFGPTKTEEEGGQLMISSSNLEKPSTARGASQGGSGAIPTHSDELKGALQAGQTGIGSTPKTPRSQASRRGKSVNEFNNRLRSSFYTAGLHVQAEDNANNAANSGSSSSNNGNAGSNGVEQGSSSLRKLTARSMRTNSPKSQNRGGGGTELGGSNVSEVRNGFLGGGFFDGRTTSHQLSPEGMKGTENIIHSGLFKRRNNRNMSSFLAHQMSVAASAIGGEQHADQNAVVAGGVGEDGKQGKKEGFQFVVENSYLQSYFEADIPLSNQQIAAATARSRIASRNRIHESQVLDAALNGTPRNLSSSSQEYQLPSSRS